jgi:hypothetical protein
VKMTVAMARGLLPGSAEFREESPKDERDLGALRCGNLHGDDYTQPVRLRRPAITGRYSTIFLRCRRHDDTVRENPESR